MIENVNFGKVSDIFDEALTAKLGSVLSLGARLPVKSSSLLVSNSCFTDLKVKIGSKNNFKRVIVIGNVIIMVSYHNFEDCRFGKVSNEGTNTVWLNCDRFQSGWQCKIKCVSN